MARCRWRASDTGAPPLQSAPMGTLYFVRHGQASFGAANYDQLSPLGERQSQALGRYWAQQGLQFDAVITGSLMRHRQTLAHIVEGSNLEQKKRLASVFKGFDATKIVANAGLDEALVGAHPALNEYDSEALIAAQLRASAQSHEGLGDPRSPDGYKAHFRVLRLALQSWIAGDIAPLGMPAFAQFRSELMQVLHGVARADAQVLVVSSGGPISTALMHVLGAAPLTLIDLNYQMKNTAISTLHVSTSKLHVSGFNALPHLDAPDLAHMRTST